MAEEKTKLFNIHEGTKGRAPGIYLDQVERRRLEEYRAAIEEREPNFTDMPPGYEPLVRKDALSDNSFYSNPSNQYVSHEVKPVAEFSTKVFDHPAVRKGSDLTYTDSLLANSQAKAIATPAGARPGQFDDGGFGGPEADVSGNPGDNVSKGEPVNSKVQPSLSDAAKGGAVAGTTGTSGTSTKTSK